MGLKLRKKVNNSLPGYKIGLDWEKGGNIATSAIDFTGSTLNSFGPVKSDSDMLQESGIGIGHGSGFDYLKLNSINASDLMSELSRENTANTLNTMGRGAALGATVGSIFPGLGTVIGGVAGGIVGGIAGIFGGGSRKRRLAARIRTALMQAERNNSYNLASALTDYLTNQYGLEHEDTQDDQLYSAKNGKDLVQPIINKE